MEKVIIFLAVGLFIGYRGLIPEKFRSLPGKITTVGLISLLVFMGAMLGGDATLMANIGTLGLQAFLLALAAIVGSVLLVFGVNRVGKMVAITRGNASKTSKTVSKAMNNTTCKGEGEV